ncbi:MAG: transposase [Bacteroidetes bacterium]|nr:transposase [Bacteroidota bacterium]
MLSLVHESLLHAELRIDHNLVENAIRPLVLGRNISLFSGLHDGAKRSEVIYSILGSRKVNGVNPELWLADVLENFLKLNHHCFTLFWPTLGNL